MYHININTIITIKNLQRAVPSSSPLSKTLINYRCIKKVRGLLASSYPTQMAFCPLQIRRVECFTRTRQTSQNIDSLGVSLLIVNPNFCQIFIFSAEIVGESQSSF